MNAETIIIASIITLAAIYLFREFSGNANPPIKAYQPLEYLNPLASDGHFDWYNWKKTKLVGEELKYTNPYAQMEMAELFSNENMPPQTTY